MATFAGEEAAAKLAAEEAAKTAAQIEKNAKDRTGKQKGPVSPGGKEGSGTDGVKAQKKPGRPANQELKTREEAAGGAKESIDSKDKKQLKL